MSKFIFITDEVDNREASKIEFEVPNNLNIFEFKNMCIRMASAMGYHHNTIIKAFETTKEREQIDMEIFGILSNKNINTTYTSHAYINTGSVSYQSI
jgi:hypothetical protein